MSGGPAGSAPEEPTREYHIGLAPGEVAPWVLLCGDPARADRLASRLDAVRLVRSSREFRTHTGSRNGREVTVMATGIGCDNTEIAVVELLRCQPHPVLIRVGTCGGLQRDIGLGDVVISTGAVRLESTSLGFVDPGYPAVANHEVVLALVSAAEELQALYHLGLTATAAGFYGCQGRSGVGSGPRDPNLLRRLEEQGVCNLEMEASTLFTLASLAGARAGAVCAVLANRPASTFIDPDEKVAAEDRAGAIALRALDYLARMDLEGAGRPFHLPSP